MCAMCSRLAEPCLDIVLLSFSSEGHDMCAVCKSTERTHTLTHRHTTVDTDSESMLNNPVSDVTGFSLGALNEHVWDKYLQMMPDMDKQHGCKVFMLNSIFKNILNWLNICIVRWIGSFVQVPSYSLSSIGISNRSQRSCPWGFSL